MVSKYDRLRAQNRITNEEIACLTTEGGEIGRLQGRLREKVTEALQQGAGLFQGVSKDGSALGKTATEIFKGMFDFAVPDLYSKLELGARSLTGKEAEEILKAANLSALSQIFYSGAQGLNLVVKGSGGKYVPNPEADVAKEVLDYLVREHSYGNRDTRTGKAIETRFGGLGYGWDRDLLRLILATLFRAGSIEISHQGQRFDSYQDPRSRPPLTNNVAFRQALFTPATPIDLKTLTQAVMSYENLTGQTIEVEKNAIATAFKKWATGQLSELIPVQAEVKAHDLPAAGPLTEYQTNLKTIQTHAADDCVRVLAGEATSLKEAQAWLHRLKEVVDRDGLETVRQARLAAHQMWPVLEARGQNEGLSETAAALKAGLGSERFFEAVPELKAQAETVNTAYRQLYQELHDRRTQRYSEALEQIKGHPDWLNVPEAMQAPILNPILSRACQTLAIPSGELVCQNCRATLGEMESDLAAVEGLKSHALERIETVVKPPVKTEKVRLADFFPTSPESPEEVEEALESLRGHLLKLLAEGIRLVLQ